MIFSKEALRRGLAYRSSGMQLEQQGTQYACRGIPLRMDRPRRRGGTPSLGQCHGNIRLAARDCPDDVASDPRPHHAGPDRVNAEWPRDSVFDVDCPSADPTGLSDALEHVNAGAGPLRSGSPLAMFAIGLAVVAGPGCAPVADHDPDVGNRNASLVDKDDA